MNAAVASEDGPFGLVSPSAGGNPTLSRGSRGTLRPI